MFDGRAGEKPRGVEQGQRTIVVADQERDLGAAKNYAIAALALEHFDNVVVTKTGALGKHSVDQFIENYVVDQLLMFRRRW